MAPTVTVTRGSASVREIRRNYDDDRHYRPVHVASRSNLSTGRSPLPARKYREPTGSRTNSRGGIQKPQQPRSQVRRHMDSWTPTSSSSSVRSSRESSRTDSWYVPVPEMESYFNALRNSCSTGQDLDPTLHDPVISRDRQRQGFKYRNEDTARQFDVSLKHIQELLWHMWNRYDTVSCYSTAMLQSGDIIYYINPFTLGPDQGVHSDSAAYLGGSKFQTGVQAKGRFAIVTRVIGQYVKVVPVHTFNGQGLGSKPSSLHDLFVELHDPGHYHFGSVSPHRPLEVRKAFCEMKAEAAAHLLTTVVTLSQKILIAGSITSGSLERLREMIRRIEG